MSLFSDFKRICTGTFIAATTSIIIVAFGLLVVVRPYFSKKSTASGYQIIYLNGASSTGKSTLARALQNKLKNHYLVIGIDQVIGMMLEKLNDWQHNTMAPGFSWQPVNDEDGVTMAYKIVKGPLGKKIYYEHRNRITLRSNQSINPSTIYQFAYVY